MQDILELKEILKINGINEVDFDDTEITPADGAIISIDSFFKNQIYSIDIEKIEKEERKIKIVWNQIESNSNMRTLKYLLEGMIFYGIIDFEKVKKYSSFSSYVKDFRENNLSLLTKEFTLYSGLNEYIRKNKSRIINNIKQNINFKWNSKPFFKNILLASWKAYKLKDINLKSNPKEGKIRYTYSRVFETIFLNQYKNIASSPEFLNLDSLEKIEIPISKDEKDRIERMFFDNPKDLKNNKSIRKLRRLFKSKLVAQVIKDYKKEINENVFLEDFPILEGAHIISVKKLISNNQIQDISNHHNGFLIDPNLHKMYDKDIAYLSLSSKHLDFIDIRGNSVGKINRKYISKERELWINLAEKQQNM